MKPIAESEFIVNSDGSIFHLHIKPEELAETVILVGDPGRVELLKTFFESQEVSGSSREFNFFTGLYKGKRMTVLSTGIGTDNIDIVMTELDALANVDFKTRMIKEDKKTLNILRIGSSGAIQPDIPLGSYVYSEVSVGFDSLLSWYADRDSVVMKEIEKSFLSYMDWEKYKLPIPYFVMADEKISSLFRDSAIMGTTISASGFYGPQCRVIRLPLAMPDMLEKLENFSFEGRRMTNYEMESSAIAGLAAKLGHKAGTICCIIANRHIGESNPNYHNDMKGLIKLSLDKLHSITK